MATLRWTVIQALLIFFIFAPKYVQSRKYMRDKIVGRFRIIPMNTNDLMKGKTPEIFTAEMLGGNRPTVQPFHFPNHAEFLQNQFMKNYDHHSSNSNQGSNSNRDQDGAPGNQAPKTSKKEESSSDDSPTPEAHIHVKLPIYHHDEPEERLPKPKPPPPPKQIPINYEPGGFVPNSYPRYPAPPPTRAPYYPPEEIEDERPRHYNKRVNRPPYEEPRPYYREPTRRPERVKNFHDFPDPPPRMPPPPPPRRHQQPGNYRHNNHPNNYYLSEPSENIHFHPNHPTGPQFPPHPRFFSAGYPQRGGDFPLGDPRDDIEGFQEPDRERRRPRFFPDDEEQVRPVFGRPEEEERTRIKDPKKKKPYVTIEFEFPGGIHRPRVKNM